MQNIGRIADIGETINTYKIFIRKSEGNIQLGRPRHR